MERLYGRFNGSAARDPFFESQDAMVCQDRSQCGSLRRHQLDDGVFTIVGKLHGKSDNARAKRPCGLCRWDVLPPYRVLRCASSDERHNGNYTMIRIAWVHAVLRGKRSRNT
jgi:hypothetical protein